MAFIHTAMDRRLYCHVLLLLERKSEVNAQDKNGLTVLMKSCYLEDDKTACLIASKALKVGARKDIRDKTGRNALCHATITRRVRIATMLMKNGDFDLNGKDKSGNTVLHLAAQHDNFDIVKLITSLLCRYGLTVDSANHDGMTALMLACSHGDLEMARFLVNECDASLTMRDNIFFYNARDWIATVVDIPQATNPFQKSTSMEILPAKTEKYFVKRNTWITPDAKATSKRLTSQSTQEGLVFSSPPLTNMSKQTSNQTLSSISMPSFIGPTPITRSADPGFLPERDTFLQLFTLYSTQASISYLPPAKAPPPPPPPPKVRDDRRDEAATRRQTTRSRFQKLMHIKKAESLISRLKRGAKSSATKSEPLRKSSNTPPNAAPSAAEKFFSVLKRRKSTFGSSQSDPGRLPEAGVQQAGTEKGEDAEGNLRLEDQK